MTKDQIIKIRDLFHRNKIKVAVFGDNSIIADETLDAVIWDDDLELVYSLSRTKTFVPTTYPSENQTVFYTVLGYDVIQYISASSNFNQFKDIIKEIPVDNDEREEKIIEWFKNVSVKLSNSGTRSNYELAKESPELYNKIHGKNEAEKFVEEVEKIDYNKYQY